MSDKQVYFITHTIILFGVLALIYLNENNIKQIKNNQVYNRLFLQIQSNIDKLTTRIDLLYTENRNLTSITNDLKLRLEYQQNQNDRLKEMMHTLKFIKSKTPEQPQ